MPVSPADELLTVQDLADLLKVNKQAVYWMNHRGDGPKAIRINNRGLLRYRRADVTAWLESREVTRKAS
jgi:predicted DNA-binding transcriptional regulator AlpA